MADVIKGGDVVYTATLDTSNVTAGLSAISAQTMSTFEQFKQHSVAIGTAMTAAGATIVGALGLSVKAATDFGTSMAEVYSLGVKDTEGLKTSIEDVAMEFGVGLTDAAKAAYQAISAGASEAETPLLLANAAKAATAGVSDLTTAIELGTGVSNAFGLSLNDVNGVFDKAFVAVKFGVTTFEQLSASVGGVAPMFKAAGLGVDEMFASVAALTKGGIETSVAVTDLKAILAGFTRQGEDSKLSTLGLSGALEWLKETTGGNNTEALKFLGSTEALNAYLALTGAQAKDYTTILEEMRAKTGQTQEAFDIMVKSDPAMAWRQLKAEIAVLAVEIGESLLPVLKRVVDELGPIVKSIVEWVRAHPDLTSAITLTAGAIGGLMIALGPLIMAMPGLIASYGLLASAIGTGAGLGAVASTAALTVGFVILGAEILVILKSVADTIVAFGDLRKTQMDLTDAEERYIDQLRAKGVVIDDATIAAMNHSERMAYLANAETADAESLTRAWFEHFAGRTETEREFAQMKALANNEYIGGAKEVALAVLQLTDEEKTAMLSASEEETDVILAAHDIRARAASETETELTQTVLDAARTREDAWMKSADVIGTSEATVQKAVANGWNETCIRIISYLKSVWDWVDKISAGIAGAMLGAVGLGEGTGETAASGGILSGGMTLVGEHGPELIAGAAGARVFTSGATKKILSETRGDSPINITFGTVYMNSELDIREVSKQLGRQVRREMMAQGVMA